MILVASVLQARQQILLRIIHLEKGLRGDNDLLKRKKGEAYPILMGAVSIFRKDTYQLNRLKIVMPRLVIIWSHHHTANHKRTQQFMHTFF